MSNLTTQLVVALSLCLLLLSFSYSAEATARPITGAATNDIQCDHFGEPCHKDGDCGTKCTLLGYSEGICIHHHHEEKKIDVNRYKVISLYGCCCKH
ncbi:hypothetical protein MKX01_006988 [Papaver californicum]|nr:hypothetical protein MKX01_006988 [Papaver californicum]